MGPCGRLRVLEGAPAGQVHDLGEGEHTLGRGDGASIRIADPTVSKDQALLRCRGGAARIENRSPRNPVHVNGAPVEGPTPLRNGDRVTAGGVVLVYEDPPRCPLCACPIDRERTRPYPWPDEEPSPFA